MIVSQICETMTGMSWRSRLLPWVGAAAFLALAGCCGSGSTHRCDFTPLDNGPDAGADGGFPCPDQPCQLPQVCCVTKAPLAARCVNATEFLSDSCEMLSTTAPACLGPEDCAGGTVCCYQATVNVMSCQTPTVCPGDGTDNYWVCGSDLDCPSMAANSCMIVASNPDTGGPLGFCIP